MTPPFIRAMVVIAVIVLLATLAFSANAQVTSTRVTPYDWQCTDANGAKISDHTRFDTAFVACLNAPNGVYVQGGRYKITRAVVTSGTASLSWSTPTQNTDGTTLTDLVGYRIAYGTSPDALPNVIQVGQVNTYTVTGLAPGTYYFAIVTLAATAQSSPSNTVSRTS